MTREETLTDLLRSLLRNWDSFDVDVESEEWYEDVEYFSVIVSHEHLGEDCEFIARVNADDGCEMEFTEDDWVGLDMGHLFAKMWFSSAKLRVTP